MSSPRKLSRRTENGRIAGICSGIAEYLDVDVTVVRLVWVVLSIVPGTIIGGVVAYLAAWIVMPEATEPGGSLPAKQFTRSLDDRKMAGVCGGIAEYFQIDSTIVRLAWIVLTVVPGAIVLGVIAYLIAWFVMPVGQHYTVTPANPAPSAAS